MTHRSSIFIPIISPRNEAMESEMTAPPVHTKLIEIYAESNQVAANKTSSVWSDLENKAIDKYWNLIAAPLRVGSPVLYKSGCTAVNAVQKMGFKKPVFAIFQLFKPQAAIEQQRLYSVSTSGPTEGSSAELGLAIALATSVCQIKDYVIVATGALSVTPSIQSSPLIRQHDVKIHPVSQVREKLAALALDITAGVFSEISHNKKCLVFTPKYYMQGERPCEIDQIDEVQQLRSLGITVIPVNWLSEVFTALHANKTRYLFQDRLIVSFLMLLFVCFMSYFSWVAWRDADIPMAFLSTSLHNSPAEPFELCKLGKLQYASPITKYSSMPTVPVNSTIAWKTTIGSSHSIDALLTQYLNYQGYYIIVIVVSEFSPVTFDYVRNDNTNAPIRIRPGDSYQGWIKLNDTAEVNVLMLLAQRFSSVDIAQLRTRFNERFIKPNAAFPQRARLNVDAVSDFFASSVPDTLTYPFLTVMEKSKCIS